MIRSCVCEEFNNDPDVSVMLISAHLDGDGGLDLHAADTVIFYDHDFSFAVHLPHCLGKDHMVISLITKASVEEAFFKIRKK